MQRFTLLHDGSDQGWQTAYLAFHIATQLGAPLMVLLADPAADSKTLAQRATQIEVGGRAAGVAIGTRLVADFSVEVVTPIATGSDGLFVPRRLIPDGKTALRYLEAFSQPLWIVSKESEMHKMAVLVDDLIANETLVSYTITLSRRIQQSLTGLVRENESGSIPKADASITWMSLPTFIHTEITAAVQRLDAGLLFIPASRISLVDNLPINCVVYPAV
jgi:hypothetical protein